MAKDTKAEKKPFEIVKSKDEDGNETEVMVVRPKASHLRKAQLEYNKSFRAALESGALLRQKLDDYMKDQGIWNDDKEKEYNEIIEELNNNDILLKKGGIPLRDAKKKAMEMREKRSDLRVLIAERSAMDGNTAEGQADNARFNSLVLQCLLDPDNEAPVIKDAKEYDDIADKPWVVDCAAQLANFLYDLDPDYEKNLTENKFLKDYKFVDQELRLLNKDGHAVDADGRLINEEGRFIGYDDNDEVYFVNRDGEPINEEGDPAEGFSPFLDDNGKEIEVVSSDEDSEEEAETDAEVEADAEVEEKPKPKRTRAKAKKTADSESA